MKNKRILITIAIFIAIIFCLFLLKSNNFLLFHSMVEMFIVMVAFSFFSITWFSRSIITNNFILILGIAYLFVGCGGFLHTISFTGMNIFPNKEYYSHQIWIASRFLEVTSYLIALWTVYKKINIRPYLLFLIYSIVFAIIVLSIYVLKIFPNCYIENVGLTYFKKISELTLAILFILALIYLYKYKLIFEEKVFKLIAFALIIAIPAELCFTFYVYEDDMFYTVGHFLKLLSFYLIFRAIIKTSIEEPYYIMFNELLKSEEELRQLNLTKDKFFSIIAHDLKNPFHSILGFSELLIEKAKIRDYDDILEFSTILYQSAENGYKLLENLLRWTQIQTGKISFQPELLNINELIHEIIETFNNLASAKKITIEFIKKDSQLLVFADKNMLMSIIRNLLSNAIKFTNTGGTIKFFTQKNGTSVEIKIKDNGIGISDETLSKFFKIEYHISSKGTNGETGTGLGLTLCNDFLQKHGSKLNISSQVGIGSEFSFNLSMINSQNRSIQ